MSIACVFFTYRWQSDVIFVFHTLPKKIMKTHVKLLNYKKVLSEKKTQRPVFSLSNSF